MTPYGAISQPYFSVQRCNDEENAFACWWPSTARCQDIGRHSAEQDHVPYIHDDVIKWKHFRRYWPFVWGIHWPPVNSPHKAGDAELFMFLWSAPWINGWVNNREAGDLRRHCAHYDVTVMLQGLHIRGLHEFAFVIHKITFTNK